MLGRFVLFVCLASSLAAAAASPGNSYKAPSSNPRYLHAFNGYLYFSASDGIYGNELFRVSIETKKVELVFDITKGPDESDIRDIVDMGDALWFRVLDGKANGELWKSDGQPQGKTNLIWRDTDATHDTGVDKILCDHNGLLLFTAGIKFSTKRYMIYDQAAGAARYLYQIDSTPLETDNVSCMRHEGEIYLGGHAFPKGSGIWRTDGTQAGTHFVYSFKKEPGVVADLGGAGVLLVAETAELGIELWITQGTPETTRLVKDINEGPEPSSPDNFVLSLAEAPDVPRVAYFTATDPQNGRELWKTDGTPAGTVLVQDIAPGPIGSNPYSLRISSREFYLVAYTPEMGTEIWATQNSGDGYGPLQQVGEGLVGPDSSAPYAMCIDSGGYLRYSQNSRDGEELWLCNTVPGSARQLSQIYPGGIAAPFWTMVEENSVYFSAEDPVHGRELWVSRGVNSPPILLDDINTDNSVNPSSSPSEMEALGDLLLFAADDIEFGNELWGTDGTEEGTKLILDISTGKESSNPSQITAVGSIAYFRAETRENGIELWVTDGKKEGTTITLDIYLGPDSSRPDHLTAWNGKLLFTAFTPNEGRELWIAQPGKKPDVLKNIRDGKESSDARNFTIWKDRVYFLANDGLHGEELWRTDGTSEGTVMVRDIVKEPYEPVSISALRPAGDRLYIAGSSPSTGRELWSLKEDGAGIRLVRDIASPAQLDARAKAP